jgi:predicted Na+-dependent transporter
MRREGARERALVRELAFGLHALVSLAVVSLNFTVYRYSCLADKSDIRILICVPRQNFGIAVELVPVGQFSLEFSK